MKRLTCEMCGSTDLIKKDGVFECQSCGCKYSVEEAKKLMVEGVVEVKVTEPVKVDNAEKVSNLYEIARRAKENKNHIQAAKYYDLILQEDPNSWEAQFYSVYFAAMDCKIAEISNTAYNISNSIDSVFAIMKKNVENAKEQEEICTNILMDLDVISTMFLKAAKNHYLSIGDDGIKNKYTLEFSDRVYAIESIFNNYAQSIIRYMGSSIFTLQLANKALEEAKVACDLAYKEIARYVLFPEAKNKRERELMYYYNQICINKDEIKDLQRKKEHKIIDNTQAQYSIREKIIEKNKKSTALAKLISTGIDFTIGLKLNGTLCLAQSNNNEFYSFSKRINEFNNIVSVATGSQQILGIREDGTVIAAGINDCGQCNVGNWNKIVSVSVGDRHSVGLKSDGTVVSTKFIGNKKYYGQCNTDNWTDIVAISAGSFHTLGLKSDGTVIAIGDNTYGQCSVGEWRDIISISAGGRHSIGLKSDGTVVATDYIEPLGADLGKYRGQCDVSDWKNIVAISADNNNTVALVADGSVIATKYKRYKEDTVDRYFGQCDVTDWEDVVAIVAGSRHTIGLKKDGTLISTKLLDNYAFDKTQTKINNWKLFENIKTIEEERKRAKTDTINKYCAQGLCKYCGGTFKGLFTKKCASCGKEKDY